MHVYRSMQIIRHVGGRQRTNRLNELLAPRSLSEWIRVRLTTARFARGDRKSSVSSWLYTGVATARGGCDGTCVPRDVVGSVIEYMLGGIGYMYA